LNLIKYFKSSFPGQYITIAVVGLIIWVLPVINPPQMPAPEGPVPLYILLYNWLSGMPYLAMAAGFLLVLFEAIWLNYLFTRHDLVQHNTSMASFMFILFVSILPAYLTLTPANITILLLILTLRSLFGAYNQVEANEQVFTAGFFVALASFFYLPSLLLYGFLVVCFIIFRTLTWREWISSLIGLITPYLFLVVIYFLTGNLQEIIHDYTGYICRVPVTFAEASVFDWLMIAFTGLAMMMGLWDSARHMRDKTVEVRKKVYVVLWLIFWVLAIMFCTGTIYLYQFGLATLPLALISANYFLNLRKNSFYMPLIWVFILAVLANSIRYNFL